MLVPRAPARKPTMRDVMAAKVLMRDERLSMKQAASRLNVLSSDLDQALWLYIGETPDVVKPLHEPDF